MEIFPISLFTIMNVTLMAQNPGATPPGTATTSKPVPVREPGLYATLNTSMGAITARLFEKEAPVTVKNFVALARGAKSWKDPKTGQMVRRPLYPGTIFHRVIPGFMIQGGDPMGTGMGGTGTNFADEFHPSLKFDVPGRLAMANSGPNTNSSQFFITEVPTSHLNGLHTIFGQVLEGQDVVTKIAGVARDANDKPRTPVRIVSITFKREGPEPAGARSAAPKPAPGMRRGPARRGIVKPGSAKE